MKHPKLKGLVDESLMRVCGMYAQEGTRECFSHHPAGFLAFVFPTCSSWWQSEGHSSQSKSFCHHGWFEGFSWFYCIIQLGSNRKAFVLSIHILQVRDEVLTFWKLSPHPKYWFPLFEKQHQASNSSHFFVSQESEYTIFQVTIFYLYTPVNWHSYGKSPSFLANTINMFDFPFPCWFTRGYQKSFPSKNHGSCRNPPGFWVCTALHEFGHHRTQGYCRWGRVLTQMVEAVRKRTVEKFRM